MNKSGMVGDDTDRIRLGFALPTFGPAALEANGIARFAAQAERLGAASLWAGDRLLTAVDPIVGYSPGSTDIPVEFRAAADPLTAMAIAAAVTTEARIGSSAINAPWYAPALLARALASIDVASGGRLIPGFGIGWSPEEYQAAGVPFADRGTRVEELLDVLRTWWTANPVAHQGAAYTVPESHVELKPLQQPMPPIFLGAFGPRGLRRVGRRASGWLPVCWVPEAFPATRLAESWSVIQRAAESAGRDPGLLRSILRVNVAAGTTPDEVAEAVKKIYPTLAPEEIFVDFTFTTDSVDQALDQTGRTLEIVAAG